MNKFNDSTLTPIILIFIIEIILISIFLTPFDISSHLSQNQNNSLQFGKDVRLELVVIRKSQSALKIELITYNDSQESIYVMSKPVTISGRQVPYVYLQRKPESTLEVYVKLFPPPVDYYQTSHTNVGVIELEQGKSHHEFFELKFPLERTSPPFYKEDKSKPIKLDECSFIRAEVGILPMTPEIREVVNSKVGGTSLSGHEIIKVNGEIDYPINFQKIIKSIKQSL